MGTKSIVVQNYGRAAITVAIFALGFVAQQVFAITAADVNTATAATGADESQAAAWQWLLAFVVGLFVGRKILGMFGKG